MIDVMVEIATLVRGRAEKELQLGTCATSEFPWSIATDDTLFPLAVVAAAHQKARRHHLALARSDGHTLVVSFPLTLRLCKQNFNSWSVPDVLEVPGVLTHSPSITRYIFHSVNPPAIFPLSSPPVELPSARTPQSAAQSCPPTRDQHRCSTWRDRRAAYTSANGLFFRRASTRWRSSTVDWILSQRSSQL